MAPVSQIDYQMLVRKIQAQTTLNRQLSSICQQFSIKSTGVKADLQRRLVNYLQETVNSSDEWQFAMAQRVILQTINPPPQRPPQPNVDSTPSGPSSSSSMPQYNGGFGHQPKPGYQFGTANGNSNQKSVQGLGQTQPASVGYGNPKQSKMTLSFKSTPFYEVGQRIGDVRQCDVMAQHRHTVHISLRLQEYPPLWNAVDNKSMRVMIFCAAEGNGIQDITFPHQSEIKVNGGDLKANLRGLKNRPGSTRPVDITEHLRLRPNYQNNIEFIYALTNKKYYLAIHICKRSSVAELVAKIRGGKKIPKDSVIQEITKKANDSEIETTSQKLSLKCPLSYMRLELPCRGLSCAHIQCFDATSYLQLQEQGPQWLCPICNKSAPFDQLAVDEYVADILARTPRGAEQVTIEPNGKWSSEGPEPEPEDDDPAQDIFEDAFEISAISFLSGRSIATPNRSIPTMGTPTTVTSREGSTMPRGSGSTSAKRPAAQVIDLTLSSDEDEPLVRTAKRHQVSAPNGGYGNHTIPQLDYF